MIRIEYFTLFFSSLFYCSCLDFTQENKNPETESLAIEEIIFSDRNDSISRWSVDNSPLIEVEVEYIGKSPLLPTNSPLPSYDWKSKNTDFYNIKIKNLTNSPIRLLKTINILQFGPSGEYFDTNYISNRYGSSTIPANGTISRENSWIWGKGEHNKMEHFFWAKIVDPIAFKKTEFQFIVRTYFNR
jgi:hypothetical protein